MNFFNKLSLLLFSMVSVGLSTPMEPAKSTLFILLDGMNPSNKGLLQNFCVDYENSEVWGKTGAAKYLQENIVNTKTNIYSRSYKNPAEAPSLMVAELAGHSNPIEKVNCLEKKWFYDASSKKLKNKEDSQKALTSIVDEALNQWYADVLNEVQLPLATSASQKSNVQMRRNAWAGKESSYTPNGSYDVDSTAVDFYFHKWMNDYKNKNGLYPSLETIKTERPDFLPSRYVFVANGMGGMVAREYIQGDSYQGDVNKILFINTPHEGTGFADQALLSKDELYNNRAAVGSLGTIIASVVPIIVTIYSTTDWNKKVIIEFTKNVLNAMAALANSTVYDNINAYYFKDYKVTDNALWYLTQDADRRDPVYKDLYIDAIDYGVNNFIGRTQLLNSKGMETSYLDPIYRLMYSYGMPSVGNGRRTSADYLIQKRNHLDEEHLNGEILKQFEKKIKAILIDSLNVPENIAFDIATGIYESLKNKFMERGFITRLFAFGTEKLDDGQKYVDFLVENGLDITAINSKLAAYGIADLASFGIEKLAKSAIETTTEKFMDWTLGYFLDWLDLPEIIDKLPDGLVAVMSFLMDVVPQNFHKELVSAFISSYSPLYAGMDVASGKCSLGNYKSVNPSDWINYGSNVVGSFTGSFYSKGGCVAAGHNDLANGLINYSVNFYDQGTYDVPVYSAYGGGVSLFRGKDVVRKSYPLHALSIGDENYNVFKNELVKVGYLDANRQIIDETLEDGCKVFSGFPNVKMVCDAIRMASNIIMMSVQTANITELYDEYDVLEQTSNMALTASLNKEHTKEITLHSENKRSLKYSDMDELLYEKPYTSIQMVSGEINGEHKGVPLILKDETGDSYSDIPEIIDFEQLNSALKNRYLQANGSLDKYDVADYYAFASKYDSFNSKKLSTNEDYYSMSLRDVSYKRWGNGSITREIDRKEMPIMVVNNQIREFRFQIDDLRPDLVWQISLDFNLDVQYYFERNSDGTWNSYMERNKKDRTYIEMNSPVSPVNEMGLFVFRPIYLMSLANKKIDDENKRFAPQKVQAEGPNLVTVSVINAIGLSASQQFSFYYRATLPYLREGWPTYLQTASSLDDIFMTASNQYDPYIFTSAEVCLVKSDNGSYTQVSNSCVSANVDLIKDSSPLSWRVNAHLGDDFVKVNNIEDGVYIIQWKLWAKMEGSNDFTPFIMNVPVIVDTKKPNLELDVSKSMFTNSAQDGVWGRILNKDSSSLRKTRIFVIPQNTTDTVWLKEYDGIGASEIDFGWGVSEGKLPQGKATLYIQSVDYAEPNMTMGLVLQDLYSDDAEKVKTAWNNLLERNGNKVTFKKGINGVILSKEIFVDGVAPLADDNSVTVATIPDTSAQCKDCPPWSKNNGGEHVVNSAELLKISVSLKNEHINVTHDSVRMQLILTDADQSITKSFIAINDFKQYRTFDFIESPQSFIPDGKYSISLVLVDEAGNSSGNISLSKTVRIDRALPIVNSVVPNEPVYASTADVDKASFAVSSSKLNVNKSSYTCYQKLSSVNGESNWSYIGEVAADKMKDSKKVTVDYSMKNAGMNISKGRYTTTVGCYDKSGNFNKNSGPFSIGFRYPVLSYSTSSLTTGISDDLVKIIGIAPNPIVPGGNVQTSEYKIEWRHLGETAWNTDGVQSTKKTVSSLVNDLAVWDRSNLPAGDYEIQLSVRGCNDGNNPKCEWVSTKEQITLDAIDATEIAKKPRIALSVPINQVSGEEEQLVSAQMLGVNDGSEWSMDLKILVTDPSDPSRMVVAKQGYLDSMVVSPFEGKPSGVLPQGLSIWQDKGEWTIRYEGTPDSAEPYSAPVLILKYTHSNFEITNSVAADKGAFLYKDTTLFAPKLDFDSTTSSPEYNYTSAWELKGKNDFELKFKTNKPFIVDVSSVKDAYANMYCGVVGRCSQYFDYLRDDFATLFVNTGAFKMDLSWNGKILDNMYPGSDKAKVIATATEKKPGHRVVIDSAEWKLSFGKPQIVSDYDGKEGRLVISSEKKDGSAIVQLGEVGYEFGIVGKNAYVTVVVKDPSGKVVKTIMNNEPCVAGSKNNAYSVSWNGVSDDQFASISAGTYVFEVVAVDRDGYKVTKKYPFEVVYAGHLIAAPDSEDAKDAAAILMMDEAKLDENNELRFVGKPDYLLTADASARVLPSEKREISYYWDWKGKQYPAFYRANRFSLGIRRQRKSFSVTLVSMMNTMQYYLNYTTGWDPEKFRMRHRIRVDSVRFDLDDGGVFEIPRFVLNAGKNHIIGYDFRGYDYPINFEAKVFPINQYNDIVNALGSNEVETIPFCDRNTGALTEKDEKRNLFDGSFSDVGAVQLWSYSKTFNYHSREMKFGDDLGKVTAGCVPSKENNYVCDDKIDGFNPHSNMLSVSILHIDPYMFDFFTGKFKSVDYFGDASYDCFTCENEGSAQQVFAKIIFRVNDSYWNPEFGYSNLANKYVRFDHTNKTLYENGKSGEVGTGTYFPGCQSALNYYDGMGWKHSSYYGLVTPFEVQRFSYNREDCPQNNPLQFSDEDYPTTPSKYQFSFMFDNGYMTNDNRTDFIALVRGSIDGHFETNDIITSGSGVVNLGTSRNLQEIWYDPTIDVYVTSRIKANEAAIPQIDVNVEYPYKELKYEPNQNVQIGTGKLCKIDDAAMIRSVDDQNSHCFRYYQAASRIHYGINDWSDSEWRQHFGNPKDTAYINNPIYVIVNAPIYATVKDPLSVDSIFGNLNNPWFGEGEKFVYDTCQVESKDFEKNVWKINREKIAKENVLQSQMTNVLPTVKSQLILSQASFDNGWRIEKNDDGSVKYVYNEGDVVDANISYVRAADDILLDDNHLKPYAKETIHRHQLAKQYHGLPRIVAEDEWVQNFMLSNAKIFNRKDSTEHKYFSVSVSQNKEDLDVSRNGLVPQERVEEIATLRGQVPKNGTRWTLSFLSGNRMVPIASGVQQGRVSSAPYPLLSKIDVDTLQGNTSFFLTYGLDDAAGDIYFKQLDVHIGHLLKPTEKSVVSSMYGNVSVLFPENAFDTDVDVTARVVSLSDYPAYDVFQGINPVGTIVEVLPSHVFKKDSSTWPRVSIEVTKESVGSQNPLDVRIYKPDTKLKKIVPLEEQELSFYNALDEKLFTCGDSSDVACVANLVPTGWAKIRVSGKTPTFSTFMLMDKDEAANVKVVEDKEVVTEFSCNLERLSNDTVVWAGLVNGYLAYPYPCVGESSFMLQLLYNNDAVYEKQGVAKTSIELPLRKNDFAMNVTEKDTLESRLALYGSNSKNMQKAGPNVLADTSLPVIEDASIKVEDYELQKRLIVDAMVVDTISGIKSVKLDFYWAGRLVESRIKMGESVVIEDFLLTKKMAQECVGCKAEFALTVYDNGHNYTKTTLMSESIYPFPKSLVLWYPLADGAGKVAKEAMGTRIDLDLASMYRPWLYGTSLYLGKVTDFAKPTAKWDGIGNVPMSVEFRLKSNVSRGGTEFSILGWDGSNKWFFGLIDAKNLFFEFIGQRIVFENARVQRGVESHYVFTIEGKKICLYKNGKLVEQKKLSAEFLWNSNGKPVLGAFETNKSVGANLSGLRFYNAELTAEEVEDLFRGKIDEVDAKIQVVRVVDLFNRENLSVDQSCDLAGMAYLRQKDAENLGVVTWKLNTDVGRYNLYVLARGYDHMTSAVEVMVDGSSMGVFDLDHSGVWKTQVVDGLALSLSSGEHEISIRPIGAIGLAAFAVANEESDIPASMIPWKEENWTVPEPKVQVEIAYPSYSDKSWMKANFRLKNISSERIENVKLRYYYSGEDYLVSAKSFYPDKEMSIYADAADVFYAELKLTESISVGGGVYYNNGPQIGAYRTNNHAPWNYDDDPSFESSAVDGFFHVTDKVAILDGEGNLVSKFSCYDGKGPAKLRTPNVRAIAKDESGVSSNLSSITMFVENVGDVPLNGFEVRYYVRESSKPELSVYDNQFAETPSVVFVDDDLYYVSFKYVNVILNSGEKSDYGNGVKFALRRYDGSGWNAADDASHYGLSSNFVSADSIVILDLNRNLLWGSIPQPSKALPEISGSGSYGDYIVIDPDGILVNVPNDGRYVLELVNASGISQSVIFSGSWNVGEHYISKKNVNLISGQYLVLRNGNVILSRILIK